MNTPLNSPRNRRLFTNVLFVLAALGIATSVVRAAFAGPPSAPREKDVTKSQRESVPRNGGADQRMALPSGTRVGGYGLVEPQGREIRVAAQVTATIGRVLVKEGQRVKAGELLIQLADDVERAAWQAAEAQASSALADMQTAKARTELANGVLQRTLALAKTNSVSPDELDRAQRTAQAETGAQNAAEGRMKSARALALQAKAQFERLSVRAPIDGEVLQVKVRPGELYSFQSTQEPLVVMGNTDILHVRVDVEERDLARVRNGASVYVTADAFGDQKFEGKVIDVGRRMGRKNLRTDEPLERNDTKILEVIVELSGKPSLVPGQRVNAYIEASG